MEKRTKLGVAATSLAVAATMIGPTTASADIDICTFKCPEPGDIDPFLKISDTFLKIGDELPDVFIKLDGVLEHLSTVFYKLE